MSVASISLEIENITRQITAAQKLLNTRPDLSSEAGINSRIKQDRTAARQGASMTLRILKPKLAELQNQLTLAKTQEAGTSQLKNIIDSNKINSREQVATVTNIPEILKNNPLLLAIGAILIALVVLK